MLEEYLLDPKASVRDAIELLEKNAGKTALIAGPEGKLLGIFTQGDMRRFILSNNDLSVCISDIMNTHPTVFRNRQMALKAKANSPMRVFPVVDDNGILTDALFSLEDDDFESRHSEALKDVPLVIMAGGKGTRLAPYTNVLPKALIPIGDYTISERIINNFARYGIKNVFFVLNYKASIIEAYFNDIKHDYDVEFFVEEEYLGTGGGLSLLKDCLCSTFIVSNCDILVDDDMECFYKTHEKNGDAITFICAMKNMQVPYGVVNTSDDGAINSITEKPTYSFLTSAGIYCVEPEVLEMIPAGKHIDFTDIASMCMSNGRRVGVFPVADQSWQDMGVLDGMNDMIRRSGNG